MKDTIKCCIVSMGIGFLAGAVLTACNKKFQNNIKDAKNTAMEKLEEAKEGIDKIKEQMCEKQNENAKNNQTSLDGENAQVKQSKSKSSKWLPYLLLYAKLTTV